MENEEWEELDEIVLRPEDEEERDRDHPETAAFPLSLSFVFPSRLSCFGGPGEKGKGKPHQDGLVARGLLRVTPGGNRIGESEKMHIGAARCRCPSGNV